MISNLDNNFPHTGGYELAEDFCSLINLWIQTPSSKFSILTSLLSICYDWYSQQILYKQWNIFADFKNLLATDYEKFSAVHCK